MLGSKGRDGRGMARGQGKGDGGGLEDVNGGGVNTRLSSEPLED